MFCTNANRPFIPKTAEIKTKEKEEKKRHCVGTGVCNKQRQKEKKSPMKEERKTVRENTNLDKGKINWTS